MRSSTCRQLSHQYSVEYGVRTHRSGFTLMEILLVLAVIAVFASMTLPSVMRMFGQQKLSSSAETVREAIALARFRAIDSGLIYQFCCEVNGANFVVVPFEPDHAVSQTGSQTAGVVLAKRHAGILPKGITFRSEHSGSAGSSLNGLGPIKLSPQSLDGIPNAGNLAGLNWAMPILFKPDGSASLDTELTVSDTHSQQIRLQVRAFTGAVSMERLQVGKP